MPLSWSELKAGLERIAADARGETDRIFGDALLRICRDLNAMKSELDEVKSLVETVKRRQ